MASLLDALLDMQRQRRAQEKEKLMAYTQSLYVRERQAFNWIEAGRHDGMVGTMEDIWGRAGNVRYDGEDSPASSSSRPLSFTTSVTTTSSSMPSSVGYVSTAGASLHNDHQDRANQGAYDAALGLRYPESISSSANHSTSSLPRILARGLSIFETTSKTSTEKISWGNRVGRRFRAYGRQIMGQA